MKKIILALVFIVGTAHAEVITPDRSLTWDYPEESMELIDGFRLYCDQQQVWQGSAIEVLLANAELGNGRTTCVVVAYNSLGESGPSNALSFPYTSGPPEDAPGQLRHQAQ